MPVPTKTSPSPEPAINPMGKSEDFPIVAIGASAGGLEACGEFFDAIPGDAKLALVVILHLDPNHDSMVVDLLAQRTKLKVCEAGDGMPLQLGCVYVIPPGRYLTIEHGALHLTRPKTGRAVRLSFDMFLEGMAKAYGKRAIAVVLSGSGSDGSLGLKSIKDMGGHVVAQEPSEARAPGMPQNAIESGHVDLVLPVAQIPAAIVDITLAIQEAKLSDQADVDPPEPWLHEIIELIRQKTAYNFTFYKHGTLQRRIIRRMSLAPTHPANIPNYIETLRSDAAELEVLAKDLLINVTAFFRDPNVFEILARDILPDLINNHPDGQPLRIWVLGCSTGEETYSLAMLIQTRILATKRHIRLQVLASDIDPDAIATAREGFYPEAIAADVAPALLAEFFTKEDQGYRISGSLRSMVVFTVHDVLSDPPFSRTDFVSCRNLLIYLQPDAQAKLMSLFHFSLRQGGILLLGNSESAANFEGQFEVVSKQARIFRRIGRNRSIDLDLARSQRDGTREVSRGNQNKSNLRPPDLGDLCRRLVSEAYGPAAILTNKKFDLLYAMGPTDTYLRIPSGHSVSNLLTLAREDVRAKLRDATEQVAQGHDNVLVRGGTLIRDDVMHFFRIVARTVKSDLEHLYLFCFLEEPRTDLRQHRAGGGPAQPQDLESLLESSRFELRRALQDLEISGEEKRALAEEALSVNEEYQATNEEFLASKEELQSLNEELTALNGQLQETLERQRSTASDLRNVLYSTDIATLFIDMNLRIRFFTPAASQLFNILPGDVGRPFVDLSSLIAGGMLLEDAKAVLKSQQLIEREIDVGLGTWYLRRALPYREQGGGIEGVVITFVDITERRKVLESLAVAERQAHLANLAKSRFLAAASHDLRQPLQSLALIQGLLADIVEGERAQKLATQFNETLETMSNMLNALLDINQIEAGTIKVNIAPCQVDDLLRRLSLEFQTQATAQGLKLRMVSCSLTILSDINMLEQMIRNLLSNALKYTVTGKILLGCRRVRGRVSIEVWDTGIGIADSELDAIFDEFHQVNNEARGSALGFGLGLSIVRRLGQLLGHDVTVKSRPAKGSVFAVKVNRADRKVVTVKKPSGMSAKGPHDPRAKIGTILLVEDEPEVRKFLSLNLESEGHRVVSAVSGAAALDLVNREAIKPDLLLADFNLLKSMDGLTLAQKLRHLLSPRLPVIILTGDISAETLRQIEQQNCMRLNKPVAAATLSSAIQDALTTQPDVPARPSI